jgi:hypothetical protein
MKKITKLFLLLTTLFFATSFVNTANSQDCSHTFNMIDSFGDGWNGNTVSVFVNDNPALDPSGAVLSAQTLASGASGSFNFMASPNDIITLSWGTGSYPGEVSFEILACDGATVIASGVFGNSLEPVEPVEPAECGDTITYCYDNGLSEIFNASVDNVGDYITVSIVEGDTESGYDFLVIYDSSDNSGTELYREAGDHAGVSITSTTGVISVWVEADSSVSCLVPSSFSGLPDTSLVMNISCAPPPTCFAPTGLSATATSSTEATVSWTAGDSETAWQYVVQPSATGEPTGAGTATTTNPLSLSGLMSNTAYEIWLRADCGGDLSQWVSTDFTTPPAPIVPDYTNDFSTGLGEFWTKAEGSINSGPSGTISGWVTQDFSGNVYGFARFNLWNTGDVDWIISPVFDLSGGTYFLNLDVMVSAYSGGGLIDMGSDDVVSLVATFDNGISWTILKQWTVADALTNSFTGMLEIELSGYSSAKFAVIADEGTIDDIEDYYFDIDNFTITSSSLGTNDLEVYQFTYFPNPVNDKLTINAQTNIDNIVVLNMLGQVVSRQSPNSLNCLVDMAAMRTGVYFVQVSIGNNTQTVRVLKQ